MLLKWNGHSCFSVETDAGTVVFDPYKDGKVPGLGPLRLTADAVFCSHEHDDHNARDRVILSEREPGFSVEVIPCCHDDKMGILRGKNNIHILSAEGMRVAHLGDLGHKLRGRALDSLRGVDVLLIPVGGCYTIDAPTAKEIVDAVRPRVVVPMHYRLGEMGFNELSELSAFTDLCDNVVEYDTNTLEITADTPAQTAVLRYVREKRYYGIDVGGTTVKLGLFSDTELLEKWEIPTDKTDGGKNIISDIVNSLRWDAVGAAIGVPGAVLPDGTVNRCVNLGWGVCRPGDEFEALTGLPCRMANDANAAALGEHWRGGGAGYRSILMVTLGTGVGGGLVMEDRLVTGIHGAGGEIGHICVEPAETESCSCGNRGCLEQYCSATGITRLGRLAGLGELTAKDIFDMAAAGNETALQVVDTACDYLGRGIAASCAVFDPEAVVLGGGVARAGEFLRIRTENAFRKYAFHACRGAAVTLATLGNDAGIYGTARLASMMNGV